MLLVLVVVAGAMPAGAVATSPVPASRPAGWSQAAPPQQAGAAGQGRAVIGGRTELGVVTNAVARNRARPDAQLHFDRLAAVGAGWVREEFRWDLVQPQPDRWEWEGHDHTIAAFGREGLKVIGLLAYSAGWAVGDGVPSSPLPPPPDAWAAYVTATVTRYRDAVAVWEIWNEPDSSEYWRGDARAYAALLAATAPLIRQLDPDAVILSGGISDVGGGLPFLEAVGASGGFAGVDGIAVHPYLGYHTLIYGGYRESHVHRLRAFQARAGRPFWITEFGFSSQIEGGGDRGQGAQAGAIVRQIVETAGAALDVRAMVVYGAADDRADAGDRHDRDAGLLRYDGQTPKQAYLALQTLGRLLNGLPTVERVPVEDALVTRYRFPRGDGTVTDVLWTDGTARTAVLDTIGPVEITGLLGERQAVPSTLGQVTLGVGTAPVYATYRPSPDGLRYFAETGRTLSGAFLAEWLASGGVAGLGLPLSEPVPQADHWVQYFERGRLEFDGATRLGLTGLELAGRYPAEALARRCGPPGPGRLVPLPPCPPDTPTRRSFPQTGHTLANGMLAYWDANGGLRRFGLPLSAEFADPEGSGTILQLFERARLEYSPITGAIAAGHTGAEAMELRRDEWPYWPVNPLVLDQGRVYFAQTGHALTAEAAAAWARFGGVAHLGYPLSEEYLRDGERVQLFERGRLVWPAGGEPSLAHVGREHAALPIVQVQLAAQAALAPYTCLPPDAPDDPPYGLIAGDERDRCRLDALIFAETQHSLRGAFRAYWHQHGGLAQFGYPISEEFVLDGRIVQYFERARFELTAEGEVRLSRLGADLVGH